MRWIKQYDNFSLIFNDKKKIGVDYYNIKRIISIIQSGKEPNVYEKKVLDDISEYQNLYDVTKNWLKEKFVIFKKYNIEDIEDRLCEFFDKIPKFNPRVMYSLSVKNSLLGIDNNKLNDDSYLIEEIGHVLNDILWRCGSKHDKINIDEYYHQVRASLYINFNLTTLNKNKYNLVYLEDIADKIINRFRFLYNIDEFDYFGYERDGRRYDPNINVDDYGLILYLK